MKKDTAGRTLKVKRAEGLRDQSDIARSDRSRSTVGKSWVLVDLAIFWLFCDLCVLSRLSASIRGYPILAVLGNNPGEQ
jgi:hypothetical protein